MICLKNEEPNTHIPKPAEQVPQAYFFEVAHKMYAQPPRAIALVPALASFPQSF